MQFLRFQIRRKGLSMIEVIFVIVVLGIVSSIGASIIAKVYESYIVQRAAYRANIKTELALQQIANRLQSRIPSTVGALVGGSFVPISEVTSPTADALQWVSYDVDSFEAGTIPGWSGFIDLDDSNKTFLSTPGSDLNVTNTVINNLGGGGVSGAYIYFPDGSYYPLSGYTSNTKLNVNLTTGNTIYERYKLAWSSYALKVENGDLYLYYNFSPVPQAPLGQNKALLLKNVASFRFKGSEGSMRIKICRIEATGENNASDYVTSCKEKVVF